MNDARLNELQKEVDRLRANDTDKSREINELRAELHELKITHRMLWDNRMSEDR